MVLFLKCGEKKKKKVGQIKDPVSIIDYKFYMKQSKHRNYPESSPVFLTSLTEAKLKNKKYGFEHSQAENSLDVILPTS